MSKEAENCAESCITIAGSSIGGAGAAGATYGVASGTSASIGGVIATMGVGCVSAVVCGLATVGLFSLIGCRRNDDSERLNLATHSYQSINDPNNNAAVNPPPAQHTMRYPHK